MPAVSAKKTTKAPAKRKKYGVEMGGEGTPLVNAPAVNTAAVITVPATPGRLSSLKGVTLSYNAAPTGGRLTIVDGAATVLDIDITAAGPLHIPFSDGLLSAARNTTWTITLAAAGAAVTGKLNARYAVI